MPVIEIAMLVDARGLTARMATVKAGRCLRSVQSGHYVEVLATDPDAILDFRAWAASTGHELLESTSNGSIYHFVIRHK